MAGHSSLIFITGGVRSGKSSFAEKLAVDMSCKTGGQLHYLATGVPSDQEMKERIHIHKCNRLEAGYGWKTIEQPVQIGTLSNRFAETDIIVLDCLTTLLNNELFSTNSDWDESVLHRVKENILTGITKIRNQAGTLIVVSNEVSYDCVPRNDLVFSYGKLLGQIHQKLVQEADTAYLVEAGIPRVMKGVR
ncbi:bifunctional adenosylcobinamide kinase/adenosylcobinamide-phosphate guanylyltransferase [Neobacillus pocheonensis]|uniref:bifunctional adenosylcobinamide kinase/adenosylcobinamide-phosphate guanylyltransferase n=1 Tax=Neobacillus pocheonensis TaxID=363869 RepID=UPI003D27DA05